MKPRSGDQKSRYLVGHQTAGWCMENQTSASAHATWSAEKQK
jgi:hypothetical protein